MAFNSGPIMLEFGMGMILGAVYLRGGLKSLNKPVSILLIAAGFIVILASSPGDLTRPILFGLPALGIVTGALSLEAHGLVGLHKGLLRVGDASYSIYLVHIFPIAVLRWAWSRAHLGHSIPSYVLFVLASMAIAIACGLTSYLAVEKPSLGYLRRWIS
jgi:peptidoglycan/LPS O-acetylase OafA/YrhL